MGTGYAMLALCLAELTSIANFAGNRTIRAHRRQSHMHVTIYSILCTGGMYGYARCSMGPKWGFIVSCFELFENNFFTLANMDLIGHALSSILHKPLSYAPLFSLLVYLLLISIHMKV